MANKFQMTIKKSILEYLTLTFSIPFDTSEEEEIIDFDPAIGDITIINTIYTWNDYAGSYDQIFTVTMTIKDAYSDSKVIAGYNLKVPNEADISNILSDSGLHQNSFKLNNSYIGSDKGVSLCAIDIRIKDVSGLVSVNAEASFSDSVFLTDSSGLFIGNGEKLLGKKSFSLGEYPKALGTCSMANGYFVFAHGDYSHAEGRNSHANAEGSHAEGNKTRANGIDSHSEGFQTKANGIDSHAEGWSTIAEGPYSHSEGAGTFAHNLGSHAIGRFNKPMSSGDTLSTSIGDVFVIGNGYQFGTNPNRSNAFRVTYAGQTYMTGTANTEGADYAEFFEWQDGNPDAEDRVGRFVTLDGEFIRYASQGDYILGIVSGNPAVVGNSDEDYKNRWLKDDFGRIIREYLEPSEELIDITDFSEDDLYQLRLDPEVEEREGIFYRKTEVPANHVTNSWRHKQSPDYNPDQSYTERKDRPEWDYVGMLGVLAVYDDGTCEVNSYCQCGENGIATKSSMAIAGQSFRVIKRIAPNIVKVVFR